MITLNQKLKIFNPKMKLIALLFVVCVSFTLINGQPQITGTDFVVDNILKPLLQDIQTNSLTFLQQLLLNMIPKPIVGKRDIDSATVQEILAAFQDQAAANNHKITNAMTGILNLSAMARNNACNNQ